LVGRFLIRGASSRFHDRTSQREKKRGIEINLDKSRSGDDWAGRVLDIVKRVNSNTNNANVKIQTELESLQGQMTNIKEVNDRLSSQNERLGDQNEKVNDQNEELGEKLAAQSETLEELKTQSAAVLALLTDRE